MYSYLISASKVVHKFFHHLTCKFRENKSSREAVKDHLSAIDYQDDIFSINNSPYLFTR